MKLVSFLGHVISKGGYICGSKQGSRCIDLECAYECQRYSELSEISWILLKVYQRIFKYKQAYDRVAREG
jgi:hypothetical protein